MSGVENGASAVETIIAALHESAAVKRAMVEQAARIESMAMRIVQCYRGGGRLYACGNGGSAADAIHLTEELVARYKRDRPGLPAHHLLDAATITCWSNDYEFETVFSRQVEAMGRAGDVLVAISTSGNSPNVLRAVEAARAREMTTLGLTGRDGGRLNALCDEIFIVPADSTARIQEGHITIIHLLCELVESTLFPDGERT